MNFKHTPRLYFLLVISLLASSCGIATEKVVVVSGELVGPHKDCALELYDFKSKNLIYKIEVSGFFVEDRALSPRRRTYQLKVICDSTQDPRVVYVGVPFIVGARAVERLNIGQLSVSNRGTSGEE